MRVQLFLAALCIFPATAFAGCASNMTTLVSCTAGNGDKALDVCSDGTHVLYRFGTSGQTPNLELIRSILDVDVTPWSGVGSSIWESVTLHNGAFSYEAFSSVARSPEAPAISGGVDVFEDGSPVASVQCDAGSVQTNIDALFEMREAAGLCYDHSTFAWGTCK